MPGTTPGSSVLEFFNDAKIFITGATGFVGKALLDKFLRVFPNVDHIYVLIRPKKGKDPQTRMQEIFEDPLFDTLRKEKPGFEKRVTCIFGDISRLRLLMSDNDYEFLTREVTHVFHSAATVRFTEKLKTALEINVLGAHEMSVFCNKCVRLKVFVHVSTAYAHCIRTVIGEDLYDPPMSGEKALSLLNLLSEEKLNALTEQLIKPWPNTYCYTKSIGENIIKENCKSIPTVIFRPGIVMGTMKEPVQGWVDNIYGPTGIIVAVGVGLLRVMHANDSTVANVIPVDLTVNAILSCAWEAGSSWHSNFSAENTSDTKESSKRTETVPRVYNFVVDESNSLTWGELLKVNINLGIQAPSIKALWYYTLTMTKIKFVYLCLTVLFHYIPAILADTVLVLLGKKPQIVKAYQKIHTFSGLMVAFSLKSWVFKNSNMQRLWSRLNDSDKELFYFDMKKINWDNYFNGVIAGIRSYILHENETTLPAAKRKMFFFWIGHRLMQFCFVAFWFWILSKIFFTFNSPKLQFKDSIFMQPELYKNST